MFESLDEQMKHDLAEQTTGKQRLMVWAAVAFVSLAVFGGLFFAVRLLE
jgi:hypothetical protein